MPTPIIEEYGDIVGGIGSYPVLGNPHYHQPTDELETINQDLVRETAKTNIASIALLASSPSRLTGLEAQRGRRWDRRGPVTHSRRLFVGQVGQS